jgi:hypothetical protein
MMHKVIETLDSSHKVFLNFESRCKIVKFISKSVLAGVVTLLLVLGLASIGLADEMGGMNMGGMDMGGSPSSQAPADHNTSKETDSHTESNKTDANSQPSAQSNDMANMPGMGEQHEATPGMDPNMPGMESDGHGEGASAGVNWFVVGGFLTINLLVIGTAGVLKFTKSIPVQL